MSKALIAALAVASMGLSRLATGQPQGGRAPCGEAVRAWAEASAATCGLAIVPLDCPMGHVLASIPVDGGEALRVDVAAGGGGLAQAAGLGLSPIGEFPDWQAAPEPVRAAFARLVRCVEQSPPPIAATTQSPVATLTEKSGGSLSLLVAELVILLQLGALLLLAPLVVRDLRRLWRPSHGHGVDLGVSVALFAAALALRWTLPVHTLIHENHHGYLLDINGRFAAYVASQGVASAHQVMAWLYHRVTAWKHESIFQMDALLSSLAVTALYWVGRQTFGSRLAGWVSASLLLLAPVAILLAPTEEFLVSATAFCLVGAALLHAGVRDEKTALVAAGALCVCLGASARDTLLPLAAFAPLAMLGATEPGRRVPWRTVLATTALVAVSLVPRFINLLTATLGRGGVPSFVSPPRLHFVLAPDRHGLVKSDWIGWIEPYVPAWLGWLCFVAFVLVCVDAARTRRGRPLLVGVGTFLIAQGTASLIVYAWFPSVLRHQLLVLACSLLPVGWLVARLVSMVPAASRRVATLVGALLPLVVGVAALVRSPESYHLATPAVREYRFFDDVLAGLETQAAVVTLGTSSIAHLGADWFAEEKPGWQAVPLDELADYSRRGGARTVYLFLDRACFLDPGWTEHDKSQKDAAATAAASVAVLAAAAAAAGADTLTPSRWGALRPACARAVAALPWQEVARLAIRRPPAARHGQDLPSFDPVVQIAVLKWQRPATARP